MAYSDTDRAWQVSGLTPGHKLVLLYLAQCRNGRTGQCDPGHLAIAKATGLGKNTISPYIRKLEAAGWIRIGKKRKKNGMGNDYTLLFEQVVPLVPQIVEYESETPCTTPPVGTTTTTPIGTTQAVETQQSLPVEVCGTNGNTTTTPPTGIEQGRKPRKEQGMATTLKKSTQGIWSESGLWDLWKGDREGYSEADIKFAILYKLRLDKRDKWYHGRLNSLGDVRSLFRKLMDDTPPGWRPVDKQIKPKRIAGKGCDACWGWKIDEKGDLCPVCSILVEDATPPVEVEESDESDESPVESTSESEGTYKPQPAQPRKVINGVYTAPVVAAPEKEYFSTGNHFYTPEKK